MLEYGDGLLFVGLDGKLYRARFDPEDWYDPMDYPVVNGWVVDRFHLEWWGAEWPEYREGALAPGY